MSKTNSRLFKELMRDEDFRQLVVSNEPEPEETPPNDETRDVWSRRLEAFAEEMRVNPPPCEGCPFATRCRDEELACVEFATWADPAFLRDSPRRRKHAETSTPDAPYEWVHAELFPQPAPLTQRLATATVKRTP